jgi:hypothetical protein
MIEIEGNIPIPKILGRGRPNRYPFKEMKIGDSFHVKSSSDRDSALSASSKLDIKLTSRKVDDGYRIWRID